MIKMKMFLSLIIFIISNFLYSQDVLKTDLIASYNVEYPIYKKKNTEQFVVFINSKENISFYKSTNQYVLDSLKREKKYDNQDVSIDFSYDTALPEEVLRKNETFTVYQKIIDAKVKYIEPVSLKWTILNEYRNYAGYKTRKAFTYAYGRKWIAWYTEDLPLNFGPYKFCGLPGIIVNIYDEKAEYILTLAQFKSKKKLIQLPKNNAYKLLSKNKIKTVEFNNLTNVISKMIFEDPNEKRRMEKVNEKRIRELPKLDAEFLF